MVSQISAKPAEYGTVRMIFLGFQPQLCLLFPSPRSASELLARRTILLASPRLRGLLFMWLPRHMEDARFCAACAPTSAPALSTRACTVAHVEACAAARAHAPPRGL